MLEWTEEEAKPSERKLVVFTLGDERYAVDVKHVESIERMLPITRVPEAPAHVRGVVNLRGVVVPVVDLRRKLGLSPGEAAEEARLLVVRDGELLVGLVVDGAEDVVDVPEAAIVPPPAVATTVRSAYVEGIVRRDEALIVLLDLSRVLTDEERASAARAREAAEEGGR
ncbi:chemotaxis protein CheW [Hydrogenibacillus schlegelii]|uniref:chemotaxis protein CheW n=1 Tax=Hydrogenibacillus schlegelii TaxID=1484 RepID=UPI000799CF25|nr:chemotaxis protein CheW [Hydrogenibacillus schlegelii]KWX08037.1 hypothetical protein TR75_01495 [Hydrogenibacillus schlegelii]